MVIKPSNWPSDVEYVNVQSFLGFKNIKKDCITGVRIKKIDDPNSIVCGQYGLFATQKFKRYDIIGQYTGKVVSEFSAGIYVATCTGGISFKLSINNFKNIKLGYKFYN